MVDELWVWLRGRFSLTGEEAFAVFVVLLILWTGLLGRYFYRRGQTASQVASPQEAATNHRLTPASK